MAVDMSLLALPEGFIANALSLTSPRDACRLSLVASTFHSASQSDAIWERFLPDDYREFFCQSEEGAELLRSFASKKEIYLYLCDHPILLDAATKSFSLEKWSGKKCYMLSAKDLFICWVDTPEYWRWINRPKSRFPTVALLLNVCWLEIRGSIRTSMLSPNTTYSAYLVFTLASTRYGLDYETVNASVGVSGQQNQTRAVILDPQESTPVDQHAQKPKQRGDGWTEVELGEYFVVEGQDVELIIYLFRNGIWKRGLIVEGIELRPKGEKRDQKEMENYP